MLSMLNELLTKLVLNQSSKISSLTFDSVDVSLSSRLTRLNDGIEKFVLEIKALGLWDWTTVVQFSEFARTLDPNSSDGVDHAWGGQHFLFGGAVSGGKVRGLYPYDFKESADNPIALSRGRRI